MGLCHTLQPHHVAYCTRKSSPPLHKLLRDPPKIAHMLPRPPPPPRINYTPCITLVYDEPILFLTSPLNELQTLTRSSLLQDAAQDMRYSARLVGHGRLSHLNNSSSWKNSSGKTNTCPGRRDLKWLPVLCSRRHK